MSTQIKLLTYNIDGLPEKLDLNDLPLILKPITWIYKLIKHTTQVIINDGSNKFQNINNISSFISNANYDVIGVQEDFNYHNELMSCLDKYNCGTHKGGFELKNLFSKIECLSHFPLPRFKCDGINIITKNSRIKIYQEKIINWNKSNGYIGHANDLLTHKGFRFYELIVDDKYMLDLYIIHMDADFYHPEKCPDVSGDIAARKSQFEQLSNYILNEKSNNPIIIIGDTNCYDKYIWDQENISINLIHNINHKNGLHIEEAKPDNYSDCDRIFFINNDKAKYELELDSCYFWKDIRYSDHRPLQGIFNIKDK